jgi:hypothetical protein
MKYLLADGQAAPLPAALGDATDAEAACVAFQKALNDASAEPPVVVFRLLHNGTPLAADAVFPPAADADADDDDDEAEVTILTRQAATFATAPPKRAPLCALDFETRIPDRLRLSQHPEVRAMLADSLSPPPSPAGCSDAEPVAPLDKLTFILMRVVADRGKSLLEAMTDIAEERASIERMLQAGAAETDGVAELAALRALIPADGVAMLVGMGFPQLAAERGMLETGMDPEMGLNFLLTLDDDGTVNRELTLPEVQAFHAKLVAGRKPPKRGGRQAAGPDDDSVEKLLAMGFDRRRSKAAVRLAQSFEHACALMLSENAHEVSVLDNAVRESGWVDHVADAVMALPELDPLFVSETLMRVASHPHELEQLRHAGPSRAVLVMVCDGFDIPALPS